ncbi:alpha/beta fold hydrolase [Herbiconiux liukaitaii]|uniref:alpha/beta fold hydrolase n=1 Tax=Herbiconiux liukaitaii TaxID=3342799 RepID=UPI0035B6D0E9
MTERMIGVDGIELCIEEFGAEGQPGVVLVPGAASPSDWWDEEFCEALAAEGYRVVRYDLRDTGRSTTRALGQADYTGDDLVQDLAELIRALGLAPAHVVGLSLGGGLAQQLAISEPDTVASLTLMSTSPGGPSDAGEPDADADPDADPDADALPPMSEALAASFAVERPPLDWSDREAVVRSTLADEELFGGSIPLDEERIRRIAGRAFNRAIDPSAGANHFSLPSASGTREQLGGITAPTLVVHGTHDPLFPLAHGEALAREIPGARLLPVPGLGHQFPPPQTWALLVPALTAHFAEATRRRA